jgi:hypothetical protein
LSRPDSEVAQFRIARLLTLGIGVAAPITCDNHDGRKVDHFTGKTKDQRPSQSHPFPYGWQTRERQRHIDARIAAIAAFSDLRVIRRGGIAGAPRIARHLWRMCVALLIASLSFFLGQQKVMPAFMRGSPLLFIPEITVLVLMIFWLFRVRMGRRNKRSEAT